MNEDIISNLPERIRLMRLGVGWSQEMLAKSSRVGVKTISSFENGSRTNSIKLVQLVALATACGYELCDLLLDPLESFGATQNQVRETKNRRTKKHTHHVGPSPKLPAIETAPKRGVTIFRSSDLLQSSLGEARR